MWAQATLDESFFDKFGDKTFCYVLGLQYVGTSLGALQKLHLNFRSAAVCERCSVTF